MPVTLAHSLKEARPDSTICSPGHLSPLSVHLDVFLPCYWFYREGLFLFNLSLISDIDITVFLLFLTLYSKHSVWDISFWPMNKSLVRVLDSNPDVWEESSVLKNVPRCWEHLFKIVVKWLASLYQSKHHQTSIHEAGKHSEISRWALCKSQAAALLFIILVITVITDTFPYDTHKDKKNKVFRKYVHITLRARFYLISNTAVGGHTKL